MKARGHFPLEENLLNSSRFQEYFKLFLCCFLNSGVHIAHHHSNIRENLNIEYRM